MDLEGIIMLCKISLMEKEKISTILLVRGA